MSVGHRANIHRSAEASRYGWRRKICKAKRCVLFRSIAALQRDSLCTMPTDGRNRYKYPFAHFISDGRADTQYREWLKDQYSKIWKLILCAFSHSKATESTQALVTSMRLMAAECKYPRDPSNKSITFPTNKLNNIVQQLLSSNRVNNHLFNRFKEYGAYLDVVFYTWKILPGITVKGVAPSDIYIQNYLDLINTIPISAEVQENKQLFCTSDETFEFDYPVARKSLNKVWSCVLLWELSETTHKQMLVILLEKILNHLDKPVLLTDFLMDSLDVGE